MWSIEFLYFYKNISVLSRYFGGITPGTTNCDNWNAIVQTLHVMRDDLCLTRSPASKALFGRHIWTVWPSTRQEHHTTPVIAQSTVTGLYTIRPPHVHLYLSFPYSHI